MANKWKELLKEVKEERKETSFLIIGYLTLHANRVVRVIGEIIVDVGVFIITNLLMVRCGAALALLMNLIITVLWSVMTIELEELVQINAIILTGIYLFSVFMANSDISFFIYYIIACLSYLAIKETISCMNEKLSEADDYLLQSDAQQENPTESE